MTKRIKADNLPAADRAKIESRRGIVRDGYGRIIRSKEWCEERIVHLEDKKKIYAQRIEAANAEIKAREKEIRIIEINEE